MHRQTHLVTLFLMTGMLFVQIDHVRMQVPEVHVVFYSDKDFKGLVSTYILGYQCTNLNGQQNDHYSSVDVDGYCIEICEHIYCRGKCVKVSNAVADLSDYGFNDVISSVRVCNITSTRI